ncbi:MAG: hypothetical protein WCJ92_07455 [Alphaproteobacteria bacterium]
MNIHLLILCTLVACLLEKHSLQASEELESNIQELSSPTHTTSFMTHQMVADQLSQGLFSQKKQRIQIALAPAAPEYLTEEFIKIVQNLTQKMDIYEKCYVIRAVMKIPVQQLTTLSNILTVEHLEQLQDLPNSERVSFIKKLNKIEPNQWQNEISAVIEKHHQ